MKPPHVEAEWDTCAVEAQSMMIGYNQVREYEEGERQIAIARAMRGM